MALWGFERCVHFQGLLRPFGARAIAAQWGKPRAGARRTLLTERVRFQGLHRRCAPRAAFGGANRHPRIAIRSLPAPSFGCGSSPESATKEKRDAKMHLFFLGALSGTRTLGPLIKSQLLYQLS